MMKSAKKRRRQNAVVNLLCLLLWRARSDAMGYSGNIVTVGTLSLILVLVETLQEDL